MARHPRRGSSTGIHHVMNRGVDHRRVFFADADRIEFGRRLAHVHDEMGVTTLAYCLMDNHFHLLLRSPEPGLSNAMQHVLGVYTRHTNDRVGRDGPLFRGRFHSIPVETDAHLLAASRYIHRNALDLPSVATPRDHRWSSYRAYLGLRAAPHFLDLAPVAELLGGLGDPVADFTEGSPVDGGLRRDLTADDICALVRCGVAVDAMRAPDADGACPPIDRTVLALVAERCEDPRLRHLLEHRLDHSSSAASAQACRRARRRWSEDARVRRVLAWVEAEIGRAPVHEGSDPS